MGDMQLTDFEPEKIQARETEKAEDQKIMDLLGRFTAQMLMAALRNDGHPKPEWGDGETWRFYYLDECRRRGLRILDQLGWPTDDGSEYVNIYTGSVQTLWEVATTRGYFADRHTIADQVWSVIEHWEPYNKDKRNIYLIKYLKEKIEGLREIKARGKLDAYNKNEVKRIPEYEKMIEEERLKAVM
ncbi:hypothetical protein D1BOALGB6SA_10293 [Olavius sp. associated proteobacterium Delta 1]|nr:hypothetical protein D1BOALGB6SA_10293 [Olavius sp. associated proteobacterium Delta 1]